MSDGNITTFNLDLDNPPTMSADEMARLAAMTDEEIEAAAKSDPDAQPLTDEQLQQMERVPNPKLIREELQLTQKAFAEIFQLSLSALRDWEQGRFVPDLTVRATLLTSLRVSRTVRYGI